LRLSCLLRLVVLITPLLVLLLLLVHLHLRQHQSITGAGGARIVRRKLRERRTRSSASESLFKRDDQALKRAKAGALSKRAGEIRWRRVERQLQPPVAAGQWQPLGAQRCFGTRSPAQQQLRSKTW